MRLFFFQSLDEVNDLVHASIYLNWLPKPFCKGSFLIRLLKLEKDLIFYLKENENLEVKIKKMEQKYASMQIVKIIEKLGNEKVIKRLSLLSLIKKINFVF